MRSYRARYHTSATIAFILGLSLASCQAGGPTSPLSPTFTLSLNSLTFTSNEPQRLVTITNLGSESLNWQVLSSTASWLTASPGNGGLQPHGEGTLQVQIDPRAVPQGSHSASLQIGAAGYSTQLTVQVQESSGAQASIQPTTVTLDDSRTSATIEVLNSGGSALSWSLSAPSWVSLTPSSGNLPAGGRTEVVVSANRSGLPAGQHEASLQLTSNGGSRSARLTLDVVGNPGLRIDPGSLNFGSSSSQMSFRVVNETDQALNWSAQPGAPWISLSASSGDLPPRLSQLLTASVTRSGLSHGTNQAPILFNTSNGSVSASVLAAVVPAGQPGPAPSDSPELSVSPVHLDFGSANTELTFLLHNNTDEPLAWAVVPEANWISAPVSSGRVPAHSNSPVTVRVSRAGLTAGRYQSTVRFTSLAGTVRAIVAVTVGATPPPSPPPPPSPSSPQIAVSPPALNFGVQAVDLSFKIQNKGGSPLTWSAQTTESWATLPASSGSVPAGASRDVIVRVSRSGLNASGNYQGSVQLTSNGGPASLSITLQVPGGPPPQSAQIAVTPTALNFGAETVDLTFKIQNTGGSPLNWSAESNRAWAALPVSTGSVAAGASQNVVVRVSRTGLNASGNYQGSIQLTSNGGPASVSMSLQVPAVPPPPPPSPAELEVSPPALNFGLQGTELSFRIQNIGGSPLNWSAQSTQAWATLPVSTGSVAAGATQDVRVRVARTGLNAAGNYQSSIQLTSNGGPASVSISLQVPDAPPPPPPPPGTGSTVNVRDYGALGNGQHDDREAFEEALSALNSAGGGTLFVPAGIYIVSPGPGVPNRAVDLSRRANITIAGAGLSTTEIRLAPGAYQGDTHIFFLLESSNIVFRDLALHGNRHQIPFLDEQNHCVEVWRSADIIFERVLFHFCRGDGIRFLAPPADDAAWTDGVTVKDSRFEDNGRSGIAVSRGVRNLSILNNSFTRISDQSIDMEPTGARAPTDIRIEGNLIKHTSSLWAVTIGGIKSVDLAERIVFRNNRIENGAVSFGKAVDVLIEGNTILGDPFHSALRIARNVTNVVVQNNDISGTGGGEEGLFRIISYNGAYPSKVTVQNNRITATGGQSGIYIRDALDSVQIIDNEISGVGHATGIGFQSLASLGTRSGFSVRDNEITNFVTGVRFITQGDAFTNVVVTGNSLDYNSNSVNPIVGILFDKTGPYQAFAVVVPNVYGPGIDTPIVVRGQ